MPFWLCVSLRVCQWSQQLALFVLLCVGHKFGLFNHQPVSVVDEMLILTSHNWRCCVTQILGGNQFSRWQLMCFKPPPSCGLCSNTKLTFCSAICPCVAFILSLLPLSIPPPPPTELPPSLLVSPNWQENCKILSLDFGRTALNILNTCFRSIHMQHLGFGENQYGRVPGSGI